MAREQCIDAVDAHHWVRTHTKNTKGIYKQSHIYRVPFRLIRKRLERLSELAGREIEAVYWVIDEHPRRERSVKVEFKYA